MSYKEFKEYFNNQDFNLPLEYLASKYMDIRVDGKFQVMDKYAVNHVTTTAYAFSNENLNSMFERMNIEGKKVLTVGSSGDQAINASYYGAEEVTIIDASVFAKPYIQLKLAAMKNLSFDEFNYYFKTDNVFDHRLYARFSHDLDDESKMFWDTLFLETPCNDTLFSNIIKESEYTHHKKGSKFYGNEEDYNKAKEAISKTKFNFITAEFAEFTEVLKDKGKFDLILLSNIFDYIEDNKVFTKVVKSLYDNHLAKNGAMQVDYVFDKETENHILLEYMLKECEYKNMTHLEVIDLFVLDFYKDDKKLIEQENKEKESSDKVFNNFQDGINIRPVDRSIHVIME